MEVLSEPLYSELTGALQQAIDEKKTRSPIERTDAGRRLGRLRHHLRR